MALGMFTAVPGFARWDDAVIGLLTPALPVVGALLGLLWVGIATLARQLPALLGAVLVALSMPLATGFLHLDGFMDVSDALLSRRPREEKLRILKDPHAGAFAVIAVIVLMMLSLGGADGLLAPGKNLWALLPLAVASRAPAAVLLMTGEPITGSGYGKMLREAATPGRRLFALVVWGAALVAAFLFGVSSGIACLAASAVACLAWQGASRSLGGMNGDVAGFSICLAECAGLVALALGNH